MTDKPPKTAPLPTDLLDFLSEFPKSITTLSAQIQAHQSDLASLVGQVLRPNQTNSLLFPLLKENKALIQSAISSVVRTPSPGDAQLIFLLYMTNRFYQSSHSLVELQTLLGISKLDFLLHFLASQCHLRLTVQSPTGDGLLLREIHLFLLLISENCDLPMFESVVLDLVSAKNYRNLQRHFLRTLMLHDPVQKTNFAMFLDLNRLLHIQSRNSFYDVIFDSASAKFELIQKKSQTSSRRLLLRNLCFSLDRRFSAALRQLRSQFQSLLAQPKGALSTRLLSDETLACLDLLVLSVQSLLNFLLNRRTSFFADLAIRDALLVPKISLFVQSCKSLVNSMLDVCLTRQSPQSPHIDRLRVELGVLSSFVDSLEHMRRELPRASILSQRINQLDPSHESIRRRVSLRNFDKLKKLRLILFSRFADKADQLGVFSPLENFNRPLQLVALFRKLSTGDLAFLLSVFHSSFDQVLANHPFFREFELSDQGKRFVLQEILIRLICDDVRRLFDDQPRSLASAEDFYQLPSTDELHRNWLFHSKVAFFRKMPRIMSIARAPESAQAALELYASLAPGQNFASFVSEVETMFTACRVDLWSMQHPLGSFPQSTLTHVSLFTGRHKACLRSLYQALISAELEFEMRRSKVDRARMMADLEKQVGSLTRATRADNLRSYLESSLRASNNDALENFLSFDYSSRPQEFATEGLLIHSSESSDLGDLRKMLVRVGTQLSIDEGLLSKIPFEHKKDFILWNQCKQEAHYLKPVQVEMTRNRFDLCSLRRMNIYKIREAQVGTYRPQEVLGECSFSNVNMEEPIKEKWDRLREQDEILLLETGVQVLTGSHCALITREAGACPGLVGRSSVS